MPTRDELIALAKAEAAKQGIEPELVCAVVEQESQWSADAIRYEPLFRARYVAPQKLASITEEMARSISWGLMQIMGQDAREFGFTGEFLAQLTDPQTGLEFGCKVLAHKIKMCGGNVEHALQAWNGGRESEVRRGSAGAREPLFKCLNV